MHLDIRCEPDLVPYFADAFQGKLGVPLRLFQKFKAFMVNFTKLFKRVKPFVDDSFGRLCNHHAGCSPTKFLEPLTDGLTGYTQLTGCFCLAYATVN